MYNFLVRTLRDKRCLLLIAVFSITPVYAANNGSVARSQFTTRIEDREPVDQVLVLNNNITTIYFFTDVRNMEGRTITHVWEYNGHVIARKRFSIKGPRWRVFSQKELDPSMTGIWTVIVKDDRGWPLAVSIFRYIDSKSGKKNKILPLQK